MNLLPDARRIIFYDLIDDTQVPGGAPLDAAVAAYRTAVSGKAGWVAGRFLCPTSMLEELAGLLTASVTAGEPPWRIGAVFDEPVGTASLHANVFDRYMDPAGSVVVVETGAVNLDAVPATAGAAYAASPQAVPMLTLDGLATDGVDTLAALRQERLRPIGAVLDGSSSPRHAATFIARCVDREVPFKLSRFNDLVQRDHQLGLLNTLAATAIAHGGAGLQTVQDVMLEEDAAAFTVTAVGLRWQDRLAAGPQLRAARRTLVAVSSDDMPETIAALDAMDLLPRP